MRNISIYLGISIAIISNLFSQDLTYKQSQDISYAKKIKNYTKINSYKCKNGTLIKIGDTLKVGTPFIDKEQTDNVFGTNKVYSYLLFGDMVMQLAGITYLPLSNKDKMVVLEKITASHTRLTRKSPLIVSSKSRIPNTPLNSGVITINDLERAIETGELVSGNAPMSREEAIKLLKETKTLLELGLIDEKEYEKKKIELTPIIMNKE